jgi:hypothetical protein
MTIGKCKDKLQGSSDKGCKKWVGEEWTHIQEECFYRILEKNGEGFVSTLVECQQMIMVTEYVFVPTLNLPMHCEMKCDL